jgi:hypothetical protein
MRNRAVPQNDFCEGFRQWLDSDQGETSIEALEAVSEALQDADVDTLKRRIIWPDGNRLTIEQTAARIHEESGADLKSITSHVVGWLEMIFEPMGLDEKQMEIFEAQIEAWIEKYEAEFLR